MVNLDHPTETWGIAVFGALAALVVSAFPVVAFVRLLPAFKEVLIGAAVVYLLLDTTDTTDAAAFAVVAGMAATLAFNALRLVLEGVLGVGVVGSGAGVVAAAAGPDAAAVLRLVGVLSVLFASPVGYAVGGVTGAWLNGRDDKGDENEDDETTGEFEFA
jgi:hypothetical protein